MNKAVIGIYQLENQLIFMLNMNDLWSNKKIEITRSEAIAIAIAIAIELIQKLG